MVAFLAGFKLGLGLIVAIGAQNAFVLRQGLRREHVFAVALFCAASDAALIVLGVSGFAVASAAIPGLAAALRWGGVAFLLWYGARSFRAAWRGGAALAAAAGAPQSLRSVLLMMAALTYANPHVWLDTVVLLGAVSAQFVGAQVWFGAGAVTASFFFFFSLAYGARYLAPIFARPRAWQVLEALIGVLMWSIAATLAFS
jgi:L-lysine exporter family protein LysE/ArgO